jgi:hypothetical protein
MFPRSVNNADSTTGAVIFLTAPMFGIDPLMICSEFSPFIRTFPVMVLSRSRRKSQQLCRRRSSFFYTH